MRALLYFLINRNGDPGYDTGMLSGDFHGGLVRFEDHQQIVDGDLITLSNGNFDNHYAGSITDVWNQYFDFRWGRVSR